jgi:hypothetical protein
MVQNAHHLKILHPQMQHLIGVKFITILGSKSFWSSLSTPDHREVSKTPKFDVHKMSKCRAILSKFALVLKTSPYYL